ncbi:MAG: DUF3024 domain-containing protein [Desulfurivibrionaceae bacterium]
MAFKDLEIKRIDKLIGERFRNRVPPEIHNKLRNEVRIENHDVIISEVRPRWDKPDEWLSLDFAKLKYIRSKNIWKLYWKRASGKWKLYEPKGEAKDLKILADVIDQDKFGCFFG